MNRLKIIAANVNPPHMPKRLKLTYSFTLLVFMLFLWSCAQKQVAPENRPPAAPPEIQTPIKPPEVILPSGDQIFSEAEDLYMKSSFQKAIDKYETYVALYPRGPLADAALSKIGVIHTGLKAYDSARAVYAQLISEYPDSPFKPDAMIETLDTYNQQEKYTETVKFAFEIPEDNLSINQMFRKYELVGDAYAGIQVPSDAFYYYSVVYQQAGGFEKNRIMEKIKSVSAELSRVHTDNLLSRVDDPALRGYLLYHMGLLCMETGKMDYALNALTELTESIPEHEMTAPAEALLNEIYSQTLSRPFTIACLLPLSGPYKLYGNRALSGIELAFHEHFLKKDSTEIRLVVKDTQSDPFATVLAVQELDIENAAAIIGPMVMSEAATLEAQARGIPILTLTQKDNITATGDYVFRNFITPKMQARTLANYAVASLGADRFAILYPDENYGNTYMNLFWDEIISLGATVAAVESYSPEQTDFAAPIKKLVGLYYEVPPDLQISFDLTEEETTLPMERDPRGMIPYYPPVFKEIPELCYQQPRTDPGPVAGSQDRGRNTEEELPAIVDFDAVFIPDAPSKTGLIIPQLAFHDVDDVYLLGTNLWHTANLIKMSRQYVQNAVIAEGFSPDIDSKRVKQFVKTYEAAFMETPGFIEAVAYDSAEILFEILSKPGIRFKAHLRDEMFNLVGHPGVTGTTHFDFSGDAIKEPYLLRVKNDRFLPIQRD